MVKYPSLNEATASKSHTLRFRVLRREKGGRWSEPLIPPKDVERGEGDLQDRLGVLNARSGPLVGDPSTSQHCYIPPRLVRIEPILIIWRKSSDALVSSHIVFLCLHPD